MELPFHCWRPLLRGAMKKAVRVTSGFGLVILGLILSIPLVPGPGFLLVFLGLVILADHFPWAERLVQKAKNGWGKVKTVMK